MAKYNKKDMWYRTSRRIANLAKLSPKHLAVIIDFVFLTMRENTNKLNKICKMYGDNFHDIPSFNMGFRKNGSAYVWKNKKRIYTDMMDILNSDMSDFNKETELYRLFCTIPFINIAKAGFIIALVSPYGGCFDLHNLKKYNIDKMDIYLDKKNKSSYHWTMMFHRTQKIIAEIGGSAKMTDEWIIDCSVREPEMFPTPEIMCVHHEIWIDDMFRAV